MPYSLRYHPDVKAKDLPKLNRTIRKRIKTAIGQRLLVSPEMHSEPLKRTLKWYRKPRPPLRPGLAAEGVAATTGRRAGRLTAIDGWGSDSRAGQVGFQVSRSTSGGVQPLAGSSSILHSRILSARKVLSSPLMKQ